MIPAFEKYDDKLSTNPAEVLVMRQVKKNSDFIQLLRNALFTVWVSPCMMISQTGMIPVTFERHLVFLLVCLFCFSCCLFSFRMGMCFAAESDVQAFIASLLCISLICAALVAQVNSFTSFFPSCGSPSSLFHPTHSISLIPQKGNFQTETTIEHFKAALCWPLNTVYSPSGEYSRL